MEEWQRSLCKGQDLLMNLRVLPPSLGCVQSPVFKNSTDSARGVNFIRCLIMGEAFQCSLLKDSHEPLKMVPT
jgi:hypothetical protein